MPNSVTKRSSRVAILAVVSVIASLFVLPIAPAGAVNGTADNPALHMACPEGVAPDAGFADVAGNFAESSIDCLKYYGVTVGTTATTYSPSQAVTRGQMALFLIRAAGPSGISVPAAADQGFEDIAGLPQATQDAINQLKQLGITTGTTATTYAPHATVARYQMALFLARFLDKAVVGPGGTDIDDVTADDAVFGDINVVSVEAYNAIRDLFELGVTTGTSASTFSPGAAVNRAQMAAFINRTMNHTNARPAGVNIQKSNSGFGALTTPVVVTYRDANFQPMANVLIDVFTQNYVTADGPAAAPLNANGTCNIPEVSAVGGGTACTIDNADFTTDVSGNAEVGLAVATADGETDIWWAWTGELGATFDADTTAVSSASAVSSVAATTYTAVASSTLIQFGSTATVSIETNNPQPGIAISITETRTQGVNVSATSTTVTTDAAGKASYTVAAFTDPNAALNDTATSVLSFTSALTDPLTNVTIDVTDADPIASLITVASTVDYQNSTGSPVNKTVSATIYDQFGNPMANEGVTFNLNADGALTRTSNASGVASFTWSGGAANGDDVIVIDSVVNAGNVDDVTYTFYWTMAPANGDNYATTANVVLIADKDNNTIVFLSAFDNANVGLYIALPYDANDQFNIGDVASTLEAFETALMVPDDVTAIFGAVSELNLP